MNVPLEAWNTHGISRLASSLGNPITMDRITASMCEKAYGRASFARVLVEVDATKELADSIEVCYSRFLLLLVGFHSVGCIELGEMENNVNRSKHDALNKLDGVAEGFLERIRRSRALRASESDVNPKPLKSILKRSIQSPISKDNNGVRKVSMNPTTMGVSNATGLADSSSKQQGGLNANEPMADANIVGASMDASDTNSLTNASKQAAGPKVNTSFASVIKSNQNKVVQITELRNEEHVEGAAVTIPLSAIEEHKAKIKKVPVWVKLHHVPIVAYSEVGLSLITTQIGKPIWLDAYTSNMCLQSWGRSAYARAHSWVSAEDAPKKSWCSTCLIFDHTEEKCPKRPKEVTTTVVTNVEVIILRMWLMMVLRFVKKKRNKKKKHQKQVDGVVLNKPSLTLHYRRVDRGNSTKQSGSYVASTSKEGGKSAATSTQSKNVRLENSFSALNDDEDNEWKDNTTWQHSQQVLDVLNESDSEVDEVITLDDPCRQTHCKHTAEDDLEVFSTEDTGLDWISAHNFLTRLQKLSSYASGHIEVSELAACLKKLHFLALLVMSKFFRICFSFVILDVLLSEYFGLDMNYYRV
ncbi:zinc knuckle CX2CX4HX4C containing protein [Tanacetum coccineum]